MNGPWTYEIMLALISNHENVSETTSRYHFVQACNFKVKMWSDVASHSTWERLGEIWVTFAPASGDMAKNVQGQNMEAGEKSNTSKMSKYVVVRSHTRVLENHD